MTCPYHDAGDESTSDDDGGGGGTDEGRLDRRSFLRSALMIGGSGALSSVVSTFGWPETAAAASDGAETADGPDQSRDVTIADRANRQHAWDGFTHRARGTAQVPKHHLLLFVDYERDGEPTPGDRKQAAAAFDRLEELFEWSNDGLLFTVSYSMSYFDRFDADLPVGLQPDNGTPIPRMLTAQQIIDGITVPNLFDQDEQGRPKPFDLQVTLDYEDPVADDDYDAVIHLASDHVQNLLTAEELLWNDGLDVPLGDAPFDVTRGRDRNPGAGQGPSGPSLEGVFSRPVSYPDRRTGFVGNEAVSENLDDDVPEDVIEDGAELSFGYNDIFRNSNPREDNATMLEDQRFLPENPQPPGVFANGSIMHVSRLDSDLEGWYGENDVQDRRERMFSPHHEKEDVGDVGENLGTSNAPDESTEMPMRDVSDVSDTDVAERTQADAEAGEFVGHAQKVSRARAQLEAHFQPEGDRGLFSTGVPLQDDPVTDERDDALPNHDGTPQTAEPGLLRRDFNTIDGGRPGLHFVALQAFSVYLVYMRHAMNFLDWDTGVIGQPRAENTPDGAPAPGFEHDGEVDIQRSGILEYIETMRRGNFVMPPLTQRALPPARALRPEIDVDLTDDRVRVTVADQDLAGRLDPESLRFGYYRAVNAGGGAAVVDVDRSGGTTTFVFERDETALDGDTVEDPARCRLYGERRGDRHPIFATAEL